MNKKIEISGKIGEDEKDAFNLVASKSKLSPSVAKIPGFNTKLIKACEEIGGVITFNFITKSFTIVIDDVEDELAEEEELEEFPVNKIEEDENENDLTFIPSPGEINTKDDDDDWV